MKKEMEKSERKEEVVINSETPLLKEYTI